LKLHYRVSRSILLALSRVLWGYRTSGPESIPDSGPVMIACNHVSNWDPILVGLGCRREIHFMAKEELFRNRFLAWLIRAYNALPVRRGMMDRKALREAAAILKDGEVLLIFPGGGRDASGEVRDPKGGVGFIAGMSGAPVVPAYITGSDALPAAFARKRRLQVSFGPAMTPSGTGGSEDYREFSQRVAAAIGTLRQEVEGS
jgi:1-acyl-sn-glycerol-3-phosphate acyltransferase